MSLLKEKAQALKEDVEAKVGATGFDISVWFKLAEMIFQALADCRKKPAEVPQIAKNPGPIMRLRLRQIIRHAIPDERVTRETVNAVLRMGKETTPKEAEKMFSLVTKA